MILLFEDCVKVENDLYFICRDYNVVCKMNIESGKIEGVTNIPEEKADEFRLGAKIIYWNDFLFFAPMSAKKIWKYNLKQKTWVGYERKKLDSWLPHGDMFQSILHKDKIYYIGCLYPAIIILDLKSEKMEYITAPYENRIELAKTKNDSFFRTDYVQIGEYMYMASCIDNTVLKFNLDTYDFEYIEVGGKENMYAGLDFDGEEFYLSPRKNGKGVVWNPKNGATRYLTLPYENMENKAVFGGVVCMKDKIIFPACFSKDTVEIHFDNKTKPQLFNTGKQYMFYKRIDDETVISLTTDGELEITMPIRRYKHVSEISDYERGKSIGAAMRNYGEIMETQYESKEKSLEFFVGAIYGGDK